MRPKDVDGYIGMAPKGAQAKLRQVRAAIRKAAPKAAESIGYMMPSYDKGRVCWFGLSKNHVGLYLRPPVIAQHKKELAGYTTTKSAVHLPLDKKMPIALVKKLVRARMRLNEEKKGKMTVCSRGHKFLKSKATPVCPVCWPGRYRKRGRSVAVRKVL